MTKLIALCAFLLINASSTNASSNEVLWEQRYLKYQNKLHLIDSIDTSNTPYEDHHPAIAALWNVLHKEKNLSLYKKAINVLKKIKTQPYSTSDQIYIYMLQREFLQKRNKNITAELHEKMITQQLDREGLFTLLNNLDQFEKTTLDLLEENRDIFSQDIHFFRQSFRSFRSKTKKELQDLFLYHPSYLDYKNGHYANGVKLFMFCRKNRRHPCLFLMKDKNNNIVKNNDGSLWFQTSLGLSRKQLPFNQRNGNTPSGVYHMDGVMPEANNKLVYGKYRRIILDFPRKSSNEKELKKLLPQSAHTKNWWKESVIARDIGRSLFRIHGTGLKNFNQSSLYYPFVPTSGCVAQKEKKYRGYRYKDQRLLLNRMMSSLELPLKYENERKIKGLLFVIDIDNQEKAVGLNEIQSIMDL